MEPAKPSPIIPVRQPSPAETLCREALRKDARTHLARMFTPPVRK